MSFSHPECGSKHFCQMNNMNKLNQIKIFFLILSEFKGQTSCFHSLQSPISVQRHGKLGPFFLLCWLSHTTTFEWKGRSTSPKRNFLKLFYANNMSKAGFHWLYTFVGKLLTVKFNLVTCRLTLTLRPSAITIGHNGESVKCKP